MCSKAFRIAKTNQILGRQRGSAKKKDMKNSRGEQRVSQRRECASTHKGLSEKRTAD